MERAPVSQRTPIRSVGRYIVVGVITAAPLAITWIIVDFLFGQLSRIGRPWVRAVARTVAPEQPLLAAWLQNETLLSILAAITILAALWALGWMTTRVVGRRLIGFFERLIGLVPFVDKIYQATKRFLTVAGSSSDGERRVVLINFPSPEMKAIGLITRTLRDKETGKELAAVYVPTSPNPTSGYIEIVPMRNVTFTDWTFDEAMAFVVTGGSNAPETITYFAKPDEQGSAT
ncbi:MAG: DUF502 domain-containing protein [Alphaproteobacteria bacterium]|nr:DUF502 domain-containing protein [Alphaproteobacteria bacterium]MCW5744290.1 DUF502 domain-containing protein [Alphaproteobacteria bacterium]